MNAVTEHIGNDNTIDRLDRLSHDPDVGQPARPHVIDLRRADDDVADAAQELQADVMRRDLASDSIEDESPYQPAYPHEPLRQLEDELAAEIAMLNRRRVALGKIAESTFGLSVSEAADLLVLATDRLCEFEEALKAGDSGQLVTRQDRIAGVLKFAAAKGIALDRRAVGELSTDQIAGLGEAARASVGEFRKAAEALGLAAPVDAPEPPKEPASAARRQKTAEPAPAAQPAIEPAGDPAPDETVDPYEDWRLAFGDCQTIDACAELMAKCKYSPASDEFRAIRDICATRQQALQAAQ